MNKLQYASDLHLEFPAKKAFLKQHPLQPVGDVLVLAGDIVPFTILDKHQDFFSYAADQFETVYWLPGNHEYYHFDVAQRSGVLNEKIRSCKVSATLLQIMKLWSLKKPNVAMILTNWVSIFLH